MPSVEDIACDLILSNPSLSAERLAELVRQRLPESRCSANSIGWYRSKMKSGAIKPRADGDAGPVPSMDTDRPRGARKSRQGNGDGLPSQWPDFGHVNEAEVLEAARLTTRHICFPHPDIVHALVEDNERHAGVWGRALADRGIDPAHDLWPRSSCAFPGARRRVGRRQVENGLSEALDPDGNTYPKQLWSFVFQGKPFKKKGPKDYALAHLADHKRHKHRLFEECDLLVAEQEFCFPFGLYSCPTNTVFLPKELMRPTDFSYSLRNLLQRKAQALYGDICNLLPPTLAFKPAPSEAWALKNFDWRAPVGTLDHIKAFLEFRKATMERFFKPPNG